MRGKDNGGTKGIEEGKLVWRGAKQQRKFCFGSKGLEAIDIVERYEGRITRRGMYGLTRNASTSCLFPSYDFRSGQTFVSIPNWTYRKLFHIRNSLR